MLNVISLLLNVFVLLLVARAVMSWVRLGPDSPFRPVSDFIFRATEPVLAPIRSVLPAMGGFDLSPLIVIVVIRIIQGQL